MDLAGHGLKHVLEALPGLLSVSCRNEASNRELGCPVDPDEEKGRALGGLPFGNVDVDRRSAQLKNPTGASR